jgi:hypothetical protein
MLKEIKLFLYDSTNQEAQKKSVLFDLVNVCWRLGIHLKHLFTLELQCGGNVKMEADLLKY